MVLVFNQQPCGSNYDFLEFYLFLVLSSLLKAEGLRAKIRIMLLGLVDTLFS